jgi:hypothetical protein
MCLDLALAASEARHQLFAVNDSNLRSGFCHDHALILYVYLPNDNGEDESVLTVCGATFPPFSSSSRRPFANETTSTTSVPTALSLVSYPFSAMFDYNIDIRVPMSQICIKRQYKSRARRTLILLLYFFHHGYLRPHWVHFQRREQRSIH